MSRGSDDVHIDARDNGPGIPADILSRVFDPFFTTKDAVHGVGLGLFVAEGLVRSAGGRITAANIDSSRDSAEGGQHGAWFRIQLPIATQSSNVSAEPAHASA
jgi:C4-dicarboxylate-specific signal transduction histidine kinase